MSQRGPTPYLLRFFRCLRLILHFVWIAAGAVVIYPRVSYAQRTRLKQRWSHQILKILAVRLDVRPVVVAPPGSLIVANHVSWLDIFAINSVRPAAFIAKSDVREWPFVGWLAERNDTIYLRRGSRGHARLVNSEIDALLNASKDVAIFPEGTTTDGTHLLGFHAALLQPAIETGRPVLPLAISYHDESGIRNPAASFAGDTTLMECFAAILACRTLVVRLTPAPAMETVGRTRRELSQATHEAILTRLGFHPQNNQPETQRDPPGE